MTEEGDPARDLTPVVSLCVRAEIPDGTPDHVVVPAIQYEVAASPAETLCRVGSSGTSLGSRPRTRNGLQLEDLREQERTCRRERGHARRRYDRSSRAVASSRLRVPPYRSAQGRRTIRRAEVRTTHVAPKDALCSKRPWFGSPGEGGSQRPGRSTPPNSMAGTPTARASRMAVQRTRCMVPG